MFVEHEEFLRTPLQSKQESWGLQARMLAFESSKTTVRLMIILKFCPVSFSIPLSMFLVCVYTHTHTHTRTQTRLLSGSPRRHTRHRPGSARKQPRALLVLKYTFIAVVSYRMAPTSSSSQHGVVQAESEKNAEHVKKGDNKQFRSPQLASVRLLRYPQAASSFHLSRSSEKLCSSFHFW